MVGVQDPDSKMAAITLAKVNNATPLTGERKHYVYVMKWRGEMA
jgi:hypothetical protein